MKTSNKNSERTIVKFHVSRGGRFYNGGHINFVGEEKIGEGAAFNELMYDEEQNIYLDGSGNPLHDDLTQEDIESGIGRINIDHEYDTTYTTYADELSDNEKLAIARANPWNCAELLGIDPHTYKILEATMKLKEWIEYGYMDLEDINLEEITEEEYDEEFGAETHSVDGKFYREI